MGLTAYTGGLPLQAALDNVSRIRIDAKDVHGVAGRLQHLNLSPGHTRVPDTLARLVHCHPPPAVSRGCTQMQARRKL